MIVGPTIRYIGTQCSVLHSGTDYYNLLNELPISITLFRRRLNTIPFDCCLAKIKGLTRTPVMRFVEDE